MTNDDKWAQAYADLTLRFNSLVDRVDALAEENERLKAVARLAAGYLTLSQGDAASSDLWLIGGDLEKALSAAGYGGRDDEG